MSKFFWIFACISSFLHATSDPYFCVCQRNGVTIIDAEKNTFSFIPGNTIYKALLSSDNEYFFMLGLKNNRLSFTILKNSVGSTLEFTLEGTQPYRYGHAITLDESGKRVFVLTSSCLYQITDYHTDSPEVSTIAPWSDAAYSLYSIGYDSGNTLYVFYVKNSDGYISDAFSPTADLLSSFGPGDLVFKGSTFFASRFPSNSFTFITGSTQAITSGTSYVLANNSNNVFLSGRTQTYGNGIYDITSGTINSPISTEGLTPSYIAANDTYICVYYEKNKTIQIYNLAESSWQKPLKIPSSEVYWISTSPLLTYKTEGISYALRKFGVIFNEKGTCP